MPDPAGEARVPERTPLPPIAYVDTSALAKLVVPEPESDALRAARRLASTYDERLAHAAGAAGLPVLAPS